MSDFIQNYILRPLYFVVMENLFYSTFPIVVQFDLKGSKVARHVENDGNPNVALKDNDLNRMMKLGGAFFCLQKRRCQLCQI